MLGHASHAIESPHGKAFHQELKPRLGRPLYGSFTSRIQSSPQAMVGTSYKRKSRAVAMVGKELLGCWVTEAFCVLVPRERGTGFLKVPYGHHHDPRFREVDLAVGCDIFGLDGALEFQCGPRVYNSTSERQAFLDRLATPLEALYGLSLRIIDPSEYWELHPIPHSGERRTLQLPLSKASVKR